MIFMTMLKDLIYTIVDPGSSACNSSVIGFNAALNIRSCMLLTQLSLVLLVDNSEGVHPVDPMLATVIFCIPML